MSNAMVAAEQRKVWKLIPCKGTCINVRIEVRCLRTTDCVMIHPSAVMKRVVVVLVGIESKSTFKLKTGHIMGSCT